MVRLVRHRRFVSGPPASASEQPVSTFQQPVNTAHVKHDVDPCEIVTGL